MRIGILAFRLTTERFFYGRKLMDKGDCNFKEWKISNNSYFY
jgi:hypothetical protein